LAGLKQRGRLVFGGGVMLVCLGLAPAYSDAFSPFLWYLNFGLSTFVMLFWCLIAPFWLWRRWRLNLATRWGKGILLFLGACLILATWGAFVGLRHWWGPVTLLAALGIAWVSDISAYFTGRKFGGKKLAPEISPGKTWAGVWGALAGVVVYYGIVLALMSLVLPTELEFESPLIRDVLMGVLLLTFLAVLGIMGDLFESLLKRQAGIKDSSNILPGHGGVLDRIDSLLAILPCYLPVAGLAGLAEYSFR
jgi:phosphatidate cytidylyltransferase